MAEELLELCNICVTFSPAVAKHSLNGSSYMLQGRIAFMVPLECCSTKQIVSLCILAGGANLHKLNLCVVAVFTLSLGVWSCNLEWRTWLASSSQQPPLVHPCWICQ